MLEAQNKALRKENKRLQKYARRYFSLHPRLHEIVRETVEGLPVSLCKGGCTPVFVGKRDECPECGAETRVTTVEGGGQA
ncbi:hypothetical protein [Halorientalis regularis]|uniref:hypothetical protein n=1 Tax=Halorientalis regularis TaxID=660518 RepID=UPI002032C7A3|nr:hypothetical protein [Halorientalis regularis]